YAVWHQGALEEGLRAAQRCAKLFWRIRSVRGFRPDLRSREIEPAGDRAAGALWRKEIWRDANLPLSRRVAAPENGGVRLQEDEGDLSVPSRLQPLTSDDRHPRCG